MPESFEQQLVRLRDLAAGVGVNFRHDHGYPVLAPDTTEALVELLRRWDATVAAVGKMADTAVRIYYDDRYNHEHGPVRDGSHFCRCGSRLQRVATLGVDGEPGWDWIALRPEGLSEAP